MFNGGDVKEKKVMSWRMKEAVFKNGMGMVGTYMVSTYLTLGSTFYLWQAGWALNFVYTAYNLNANAVTRVELLENGQQVNLKFGKGRSKTVAIKDIQKVENERSLVETYEESLMFPIKVGGKTFYLHGQGHESIKQGELFRAIINGQSIKI